MWDSICYGLATLSICNDNGPYLGNLKTNSLV